MCLCAVLLKFKKAHSHFKIAFVVKDMILKLKIFLLQI